MESTMQMMERRNDIYNELWSRARRQYCTINRNGQRVCRRESFFHRVGRWILAGVLVFFGLIILMILCCCIRRRRSKRAKEAAAGYNAQYATPHVAPPPVNYVPPASHPPHHHNNAPPSDAHPVNPMSEQLTGTTGQGAATQHYAGGR